ncbi:MAG: prephenate dehydratase domain-containing protein [Candidatus Moraniibacteriota bacterium]
MSKKKVAYLGNDNQTFGYQAMRKFFGDRDIVPIGCRTHLEVCEKVGRSEVSCGVVAIENVLDGVVPETARSIERVDGHYGLKIWGEVILPIRMYCANQTGSYNGVQRVVSHPSALGQCSYFVGKLFRRGIVTETCSSTGVAAIRARDDASVAALASREAIDECNLKYLESESVTNHVNSATRFFILGKQHARKTGDDKTCFLVNLDQARPGGLADTLDVFASEKINILLMYPISIFGKRWEYTWMIEVGGHITDEAVSRAWDGFNALGLSLRPMQFLGSYPKGTLG